MEELNELLQQRRAKIDSFEAAGLNPFANDFKVSHTTAQILDVHKDDDKDKLETFDLEYRVAGRIMARRDFGKAAFLQLQDGGGRIQVYVARNQVGEDAFELFKSMISVTSLVWQVFLLEPKRTSCRCVPLKSDC